MFVRNLVAQPLCAVRTHSTEQELALVFHNSGVRTGALIGRSTGRRFVGLAVCRKPHPSLENVALERNLIAAHSD